MLGLRMPAPTYRRPQSSGMWCYLSLVTSGHPAGGLHSVEGLFSIVCPTPVVLLTGLREKFMVSQYSIVKTDCCVVASCSVAVDCYCFNPVIARYNPSATHKITAYGCYGLDNGASQRFPDFATQRKVCCGRINLWRINYVSSYYKQRRI